MGHLACAEGGVGMESRRVEVEKLLDGVFGKEDTPRKPRHDRHSIMVRAAESLNGGDIVAIVGRWAHRAKALPLGPGARAGVAGNDVEKDGTVLVHIHGPAFVRVVDG
jgi:hypothetical protein